MRAGILAVSRGQTEAAYALGLRPGPTLRLVVVPQALRVIIPPLTSQYLNLTKNSSLAVAIGYPDLVAVFAGTVLNQTGQAIEVIAITMVVYLAISLVTSLLHELVQPPHRAGGALRPWQPTANSPSNRIVAPSRCAPSRRRSRCAAPIGWLRAQPVRRAGSTSR